MAVSLYDLQTLAGVSRRIKTAPLYWLQFFPGQINSNDEWIWFDKVYGDDRKLAPFVVPNAAGRPGKLDGYESLRFKPAYAKLKDPVDPNAAIQRVPGEAFGGTLTTDQRIAAMRVELIRRQKVKHKNTQNWLAARAIIDGKVTITGEDYPTTLVDFRRDPSLTIVLTGAAKWDTATGKPLDDIRDARINASELSGARVKKWTFGGNAWALFAQRVDLKELQNINYRGQNTDMTLIDDGYPDTVEFMGTIAGNNGQGEIQVWVDTTRYIDETGVEQFYLDQNTIVGVSDMVDGVRCFGAIQDAYAGYQAIELFQKNYITQDPSIEFISTQSGPLMVPKEPNATVSIKVA